MRKPRIGEPYWIEWIDAYTAADSAWTRQADVDEFFEQEMVIWTMGWLQKVTKHYYIFAGSVSRSTGQDQQTGLIAIPKGMILQIKEASYG